MLTTYTQHTPSLEYPTDDYGDTVTINLPIQSWIYSTCTYGSFGEGWDDFCQDI